MGAAHVDSKREVHEAGGRCSCIETGAFASPIHQNNFPLCRRDMPIRHVVVDGSNIATEGGSIPSLKQLDEAVREFIIENPGDVVTVVVDASFGHRIDPSEREEFERAESAGEIVLPPAGAIGRGDAFLLRIADKAGAVVLSNDSFQEFHGEYEWLFDKGRLIGGKPVPGIGWIFTPRTPVRGAKSRESMKEAKRKKHSLVVEEAEGKGLDMAAERSRGRGGERKLQRAIAVAAEEAVEPAKHGNKQRRRRNRAGVPPSEPLNEPLNFITFIASNQLGDKVEGTVEEFTSHGAFVSVDGARCYVPLSAMGEPAPRSAREVLRRGELRQFVVQAFDALRRGIELALPGFARISGSPTAETVEAEIHRLALLRTGAAAPAPSPADAGAPSAKGTATRRGGGTRKGAAAVLVATGDVPLVEKGTIKAKAPAVKGATAKGAATQAKVAAKAAATPAKGAVRPAKAAATPAKAAATPAKGAVRPTKGAVRPAKGAVRPTKAAARSEPRVTKASGRSAGGQPPSFGAKTVARQPTALKAPAIKARGVPTSGGREAVVPEGGVSTTKGWKATATVVEGQAPKPKAALAGGQAVNSNVAVSAKATAAKAAAAKATAATATAAKATAGAKKQGTRARPTLASPRKAPLTKSRVPVADAEVATAKTRATKPRATKARTSAKAKTSVRAMPSPS